MTSRQGWSIAYPLQAGFGGEHRSKTSALHQRYRSALVGRSCSHHISANHFFGALSQNDLQSMRRVWSAWCAVPRFRLQALLPGHGSSAAGSLWKHLNGRLHRNLAATRYPIQRPRPLLSPDWRSELLPRHRATVARRFASGRFD